MLNLVVLVLAKGVRLVTQRQAKVHKGLLVQVCRKVAILVKAIAIKITV